MDFHCEYKQKLVSADTAVTIIKSGDWLDYGWCNNRPVLLDEALAKRTDELHNINIRGAVLLTVPAIFRRVDAGQHFTWNSWHMSAIDRHLIDKGCAFYIPLRYSELPRYYADLETKPDVVMIVCSPMDKFGYFNFGPNASHMLAACKAAKKIIIEINSHMPYCYGGFANGIHISDVDFVVEGNNPPLGEIPNAPITVVDTTVANLIVNKIPDGACLQLGIGGMPNAVGSLIAQSDLKDLSVHTEMYVDAFVDLAQAGKITGKCKSIDTGRQTYAFGAGTRKMYDYMDHNPELMNVPVSYTNDVRVISQIDNFISINNTVDVDILGQISAESSGYKQISGAGGQLDFVLGAYLSKGGKSFICCSSTYTDKNGELHSRILPTLHPGSVVTDTRTTTHYLVTEYGMANLKGLSTWQRAEKIIALAHPQFREQLIADAEKLKLWRRTNKL